MKKKFVILLAVVGALMAALMLAACSQPAGESAQSSAQAAAESSAVEGEDAQASEEAEGEGMDAAAETAEYKGIPAFQPADHEGRTSDMCPTCHLEGTGGAATIPDDHYVNGDPQTGELEGARLQCVTCHLVETA